MSTPSWKWLSSRPNPRARAAGAGSPPPQAPSRPCLPAVEPLGDRILLSAVAPAAASEGPPPIDRVLIGLIKGELNLATGELAALKLAGGDNAQLLHKLTEGFLKIDDVINKVGDAVIKGDLTGLKEDKALELLNDEFLKIDAAVGGLSGDAQQALKAAIDGIKLSAGELLGGLTNIKLDELSHKEQEAFLKITDAFSDADAGLLKIEEAVLARKAGKGQQEFLVIKMNDILVSSFQKLDDAGLKEQLSGIVADTEKILIGLLQPGETGGDVIG
jgi:hypothetical protein